MATQPGNLRDSFARLFNYAHNTLTVAGVVITTLSAIAILVFMAAEAFHGFENPYVSIFAFLVLPGIFVVGLLLIPIGMWRRRRSLLRSGATAEEMATFPRLDFNDPRIRRLATVFIVLTVINAVILGSSSYFAVEEMDSVTFCGETCHTVMLPEFTAYHESAHSRVACVQCHIGPGASWFVKSKLDGLRQVWHTALNTYPRPIETPLENLRPARETCEQCHWPYKHHGDKLKVFGRFATDEQNTPSYTAMLLKTGGGSLDMGSHGGIHWWHIYSDNRIRYVSADDSRQEILWVELTTPDGVVHQFSRDGEELPPEQELDARARIMDCIDCHNRPTHLFKVPSKSLDDLLEAVPDLRGLPYFKKQALAAIKGDYPTHEQGMEQVRLALVRYYETEKPDVWSAKEALVRRGADEAAKIYGRTVFPHMKTNWETHPNNIGHDDFPGCWRCHDGEMVADGGERYIPVDCDTCHVFLVEDSPTRPDLGEVMGG